MSENLSRESKQASWEKALNRFFPYCIAAIISAVIVIIAFIKRGIAPFGEKSILCMDLWGQYFPMYVNNKQAEGISGLLYSWNGALGFNNWAQSAYYCNSIFIFLFRFVPTHLLVKALDIFCLIKIVLSSVSCLSFFHFKFKRRSPILIAGAVSYSVCAYMLAFISQPMWTDSLFYAPLVLIGIERLIYQKKPLMYTLTLAVSIMSSFYIGIAMCLFSVVYFIANSVLLMRVSAVDKHYHLEGVPEFGYAILRFGVFSLLAGAISAAVIIPIGLAISKTVGPEAGMPDTFKWYGDFTFVLRNMLPEMRLYEEYIGANLFSGTLVFLAVPIYFMNERIRWAERAVNAIVLAFLVASLNCNLLEWVWHGFRFPNQLPGRWTFLYSLFVIMISSKGLLEHDQLTPVRAIAGCVCGLFLFYVVSQGLGDTPRYDLPSGSWIKLFAVAVAMLVGAMAACFANEWIQKEKCELPEHPESLSADNAKEIAGFDQKPRFNKAIIIQACATVIAIIMVYDSANHFIKVAQYEKSQGMQVSEEKSYTNQLERALRNGQIWKSKDDGFYRVEANGGFTFNPSMMGDYRGIGYYSSTMDGGLFKLFKYMGNRVYGDKVSTVYSLSSPIQNGVFGVKYIMDFNRNLDRVVPGTMIIEENEDGHFRENTTALPLAYAVSDDLLKFEVTDEIHSIKNQNDLLNMMCGEEINAFKELDGVTLTTENVRLGSSDNWNTNYFYLEDGQSQAILHYSCTVEVDGDIYFEHNFRAGSMHVTAPGVDKTVAPGNGLFAYVGRLSAGDVINIDVTMENIHIACYGLNFYRFDEQAWNDAFEKLNAQGLDVTSFMNTKVEGNISLDRDSLVFASMPDDGGWKVYCDEKEVPIERVCGALIAARIPQGNHEISLRYHVPGLTAGLTISILGFVLSVVLAYDKRIARRFRKRYV